MIDSQYIKLYNKYLTNLQYLYTNLKINDLTKPQVGYIEYLRGMDWLSDYLSCEDLSKRGQGPRLRKQSL